MRNRLWALAALVPLLTIGVLALESGYDGALVPSYQSSVDSGGLDVDLDLTAVAEIEQRGIDVCPTAGPAIIPTDLAGGAAAECHPVDGHGGVAYVIGMSLAAAAGAGLASRFANRAAALVTIAVALDAAGALFVAYATRAWLEDWWGVAAAGTVGVVLSVVMLVIVVPTLVLHIPTGRLRTPRWRVVVGVAVIVGMALTASAVTYPIVIGSAVNPLSGPWSMSTADSVMGLGWTAWMGVMALAAISLLWRIRDGVLWLRARRRRDATPADGASAPAVSSRRGSG